MPDILDEIQQGQDRLEQTSLRAAANTAGWATTFSSIPSSDRLRATRNLTDQVEAAMARRAEMAIKTDEKAQRIHINDQRMKMMQDSERFRRESLQAELEATNASENRKLVETKFKASQKAGLNNEMMEVYKKYRPGTDEFRTGAAEVMTKYQGADTSDLKEIASLVGIPDNLTPEEQLAEAKSRVEAFKAGGVKGVELGLNNGRPGAVISKPEDAPEPQKTRAERLKAVSDEIKNEYGVTFADIRQRGQRGDEISVYDKNHKKTGEKKFRPASNGYMVRTYLKGDEGDFVDIPVEEALAWEKRVNEEPEAPTAAPSESSIPTLTSKDEFDALPSGTIYLRDGKQFRKP